MLIHGFPASGQLWNPVIEQLSNYCTLLIPDLPGTGKSLLDQEQTSIEQLAGILPAILEHAGIEKCCVAGHSMGGYIGLAAAELYPEKIQGLALLHSTAAPDSDERKVKRKKSIELIHKGGTEAFLNASIPDLFARQFKQDHPEAILNQINEALTIAPITLIAFYNAMMERPDRVEVLRRAHFPIMFILGKDDLIIPYQSVLQQCTVSAVSFIKLYGASAHMSMIEEKEILQSDLLNFVNYCLYRAEPAH